MNKYVIATRLILTAILMAFVYQETGIATTVFAILIALSNESSAFITKHHGDMIRSLKSRGGEIDYDHSSD